MSATTFFLRARLPLAVAILATLGSAGSASAAPAPVPCTDSGGGHHACQWYVAGNGTSGGSPVLDSAGARVGFLHKGSNWVVCQKLGRKQTSGQYFNHTWAWTEADDQKWGWVNAVWASGGDNDGGFSGVPACGTSHGSPPSDAAATTPPATTTPAPTPAPAPAPTPAPTPAPAQPAPGTVLPNPVDMGSYGTYHFRESLFRSKKGKMKRWNFDDWTPEQMMSQLNSNFSHYFTFTGCGKHLKVGQKCSLDTTFAPDAPVEVIAVAPDGFALRSRGGHPEGKGRTIRFQFQTFTNEAEISTMSLEIEAWGPLGGSSRLGPLNSNTVAKTSWGIFGDNVKSRFPQVPPGGFLPSGGGIVV